MKKSAGQWKTFHNSPREWELSNYDATKGDFALGYFEHGVTPVAARCAYTLMPSSNPQAMEAFAAAMRNPATAAYRILQQDAQAHIVWDREFETTGYVIFNAAWKPATSQSQSANLKSPLLRAVNRPCYVMLRVKGQRLVISVACTDKNRWGALTKRLHTEPEMAWRQEPNEEDRQAVIALSLAGVRRHRGERWF